jgi:hypothetical protein
MSAGYTLPELRAISRARQDRVPWSVLEARHGRQANAMRQACRRHGLALGPAGRPGRDVSPDYAREQQLRRASRAREDGATWDEAAALVEWVGEDPADSLRKSVARYRQRMRERQ